MLVTKDTTNPGPQDVEQERANAAKDGGTQYWRTTKHPWEIYLSFITIVMLIGMSGLLVAVAWRSGFNLEFQRTFLLLTIIFAALFLIVAGYSDDQVAPVFSLLGAIVGYLFGRAQEPPKEERPKNTTRDEEVRDDPVAPTNT